MTDPDLLRLCWSGLHPYRMQALLEQAGTAGRLVRRLEKGAVEASPEIVEAVGIDADARREQLRSAGIEFLTANDPAFPSHVRELPDRPLALFVRGSLPDTAGVGVVGTRRATRYGLTLGRQYGTSLAAAGWVVISGLARGVDGAAHEGTVAAGGRGIAVLGSGVDVCYPREHRRLAEQLVDGGGAVVSEYPPGAPPRPWRFPPRNRIISGLSGAIVVVEARVDGGALITARHGLAQGREILAVPGDIDRPGSEGCNRLIRDGAHPVFDPPDLIEALSTLLGDPPQPAAEEEGGSPLLAHVGAVGSTVDELAERLEWPARRVLEEVGQLELAGLVRWASGMVTK